MKRIVRKVLTGAMAALFFAVPAVAQTRLNFDLSKRGPEISPSLFGIFFEEINRGGDGGLYGELIANRSFEDNASSPDFWSKEGSVTMSLVTDNLLNKAQGRALQLDFSGTSGKVKNSGYWGIQVVKGETYRLTFWARGNGKEYPGNVVVTLLSAGGTSCGTATLSGPFAAEWKKYKVDIVATASSITGTFQLQGKRSGTLVVDVVSLFGPTYKDHENGLRTDLAQMLADIHPGFMRFPGGCYVEGTNNGVTNRFEWKKTIGPIEERPGHRNHTWGYHVNDGMGYHEYLQFCEDLGAEPLFVVNVGMGHWWCHDYTDIDEYVQEALDAIEYANGDTTTTWGALRAKNGHPAPFNLKYIEVGNENYNFYIDSNADQSDHYPDRYYTFYKAIHAAYPDIVLVGNVESWGTDTPSWRNTYPCGLIDEHYYRSPSWFVNNYAKYDSYSRAGAKVYVGEYAVTQDYGTLGNLNAALGEAVFMQGMENNSDVVVMSSYAPIFCNENAQGWMPDMIRFNCYAAYGTPSYYVQKLFGSNVGRYNVKWTETHNVPGAAQGPSAVGLGTWNTAATFTDVKLTDAQGNVLLQGDGTALADWNLASGTWSMDDGTLKQASTSVAGAICTSKTFWENDTITLSVKATKTSGSEGFLIIFDYKDANNYSWWNIGGWNNSAHGIETAVNGAKSTVASASGSLTTGQAYDLCVEKMGSLVRCYMDGTLIHEANVTGGYDRGVYVSSALNETKDKLIVKLTNPNGTATSTVLSFASGTVTGAALEVLTSENGTDENSLSKPKNVVPKTQDIALSDDGTIAYEAPAYSLSILTLDVSDVEEPANEQAEIPAPAVIYTFEDGKPIDDSGTYPGELLGQAEIVALSDGNHALYTGALGGAGGMNLGLDMPKAVLGATSDYTISIDLLNCAENNLSSFAWALAFANGTDQYFGLINGAGNGNWYAEIKNSATENVRSHAGMTTGEWHNIAYVQDGGTGRIYLDGRLYREKSVSQLPRDFIESITSARIAHSPFAADACMENAYFDNLRFYQSALSAAQVAAIASETAELQNDELSKLQTANALEELIKRVVPIEKYAENEALSEALSHAQGVLSAGDANEMEQEVPVLQAAFDAYKQGELDKAANGQDANLSFLIENGLFTQVADAWQGDDLTGISSQTAEQFSKIFDNYQILSDMPAGTYKLVVSAFYRNGAVGDAYTKYQNNGAAANLAQIYISKDGDEASARVANLYSASDVFTNDPYTFPDNLDDASDALNDGLYENEVLLTVAADGTLRIGIRKTDHVAWDWTAFDNFRLYYLSEATGIEGVDSAASASANRPEIYDLQGRRLERITAPGIYIIGGKKVLRR